MTSQSDKVKTFTLEKAREIYVTVCGMSGDGQDDMRIEYIAQALKEAREQALEEAAMACDNNGWIMDKGNGITAKASNIIRALKTREGER